jgi:hypothetical protein
MIPKYLLAAKYVLITIIMSQLIACGGGGSNNNNDDIDTNSVPIFTSDTSSSTAENSTETGYAAVATDGDGDTVNYSVSGGDEQSLFSIDPSSGVLSFNTAPDFELPVDNGNDNNYEVTISANDGNGGVTEQAVTVTVTNINEAIPVFTSGTSSSTAENSTETGYTAMATDGDGDSINYSVSGGNEQSLFSIDPSSGVLSFNTAPDFEEPTDNGSDNNYEVTISADDGNSGVTEQAVTVSVTNENQLAINIVYPTGNANLDGVVTQTTVTGNIIDNEDGVVELSDVDSITVNGITTTMALLADQINWSVQVSVVLHENTLSASASLSDGAILSTNQLLNNEVPIRFPNGVALDSANNRVLFADDNDRNEGLISIDLSSNTRTIISNAAIGTGANFDKPIDVVYDNANNRALVADSNLNILFGVDLTTGDRTIISDINTGTGTLFTAPNGIVLDNVNNRVLLVDRFKGFFAVDLANGDRTILSDNTTGTGTNFAVNGLNGLSLDSTNNRVLIADGPFNAPNTLFNVDLTNGNRSVLSDNTTGTGTNFSKIKDVSLDSSNNRALIIDTDLDALFAVDLTTGNRTILSDSSNSGPIFLNPTGIFLDSSNGRALIIDKVKRSLVAVDLDNGNKTVISQNQTGTGDGFSTIGKINLDSINNRALVVDETLNALFSVDISTGARTILSDTAIGSGTNLTNPRGFVLDTNDHALVVDFDSNALFSVDLSNGDRTILSDDTTGSGTGLDAPYDIALDSNNNRALVVTQGNDTLFAIDLNTGNRTIISDSTTGTGILFSEATGIVIDNANNRALVIDISLRALFAIELTTGNRSIIDTNTGAEYFKDIILDDANNRVLILDANSSEIIAIDLNTNVQTSFYNDTSLSSGQIMSTPVAIAMDTVNNRLFVADNFINGLFVIELATGERAVASQLKK